MNLRWLLGNFTDPQYKLARPEQFRLSNMAHKKYVATTSFLARTALIIVPFLLLISQLDHILAWLTLPNNGATHAIAMGVLLLLFWPWCAWMYRSLYVVPVRKAMRESGYDLCLGCGYELRGLDDTVERCPECGAPREATP